MILSLFLSPIFFGTVEVWSISIIELLILVTLFIWLKRVSRRYPDKEIIIPDMPFRIPLLILILLGLFQIMPIPMPLIKILSPGAYEIYIANNLYGDTTFRTISIYPHGSLIELIRLITCITAFFLTIQLFSKERELLGIVKVMMVIGTLIALIGIFQMIFNNGRLLWIREMSRGGTPFGPYVNRNHFAGLMEMLIPISTGMLITYSPHLSLRNGLRNGISEFMRQERANIFILSFTSVLLMMTALFLSLSRGGITGLCTGMLFFGVLLILRRSTRKKGLIIIAIFATILFTVGWFGWDRIIERFERLKGTDVSSEMRFHNWKDSLRIVKDFPLTGTGIGTYEHIYPKYKTITTQEKWEHAHNDFIEVAVEMGIAGMLPVLYLIVSFYRVMITGIMKRRLLEARLLGIGALAGITGLLIHSSTDFNLHIGANALYFSVLSAIAIIAIRIKPSEEKGTMLEKKGISRSFCLTIYALITLLSIVILMTMIAEIYNAAISGPLRDEREGLLKKKDILTTAMKLSPLDGRFPFARGNISASLGMDDRALMDYIGAVKLDPLNGEYLQLIGLAFDRRGERRLAERSFALSILYDPTSAWLRKNHSIWLISRGRRDEALSEMSRAIALDPSNTRLYLTGLIVSGFSLEDIRAVIPENSLSLLLYGRFREERGEIDEALDAYMNALSTMKKEGIIMTEVYLRLGGIYEKRGMLKEALSVYKEAITQRPDDYSLRLRLGAIYEKLDIPYRAIEEYEKALVLNPSNRQLQIRLRRLRGEER